MNIGTIIDSKSKTFLAFCFCFLAGIAVGSLYNDRVPGWLVYAAVLALVGNILVFWRSRVTRFVLVCALVVAGGFFRYTQAMPDRTADNITRHYGETVSFAGMVATEPDVRQDGVRYVVESRKWKMSAQGGPVWGGENRNIEPGERVYIKSNLYPRYEYGDIVDVECTLARPEPIDNFRYDMYLARYGVFALCQRPTITPTGDNDGNPFRIRILGLRDRIADRINELWHEPYANFMAGLLYGYRGGLGDLSDAFARTGVSHIVAVSGYNISIIASVLMGFFIAGLWIPRKQAFWLILGGIALYVLFTGASASVVRAGSMGSLVLLSQYLGRPRAMINILLASAVVMTAINPYILLWDVGFQLSFLSTAGLLFLAPTIESWFSRWPTQLQVQKNATSTVAAIAATLPLMLYQFGQMSLVAPIVNIAVLWVIPVVMLAGFAAVIASFLWYPLGQWVGVLAFIGMKYVTTVVEFFSSFSFASATIYLSWWGMVMMYGTLGWWYKRKLYKK